MKNTKRFAKTIGFTFVSSAEAWCFVRAIGFLRGVYAGLPRLDGPNLVVVDIEDGRRVRTVCSVAYKLGGTKYKE